MNQSETITKFDAALRQLDTALYLWINDLDGVSIVTLAASSHQIVHDLNQKAGGEDLFFDTLNIKDEYRRDFVRLLKAPWNFFKHSEKESLTDTIEVREDSVLMFFLFSIKGLVQLGHSPSGLCVIFLLWYGIHFPETVRCQERFRADFQINEEREGHLRTLSKTEFLNEVMAASYLFSPTYP